MVTAPAVLRGDQRKLLEFSPEEHPLALQLGGSEPGELAAAALVGEGFGYDEINLNVGCPSDRVQSGRFGACLMKEPALVAECLAAMQAAVRVPITLKCRLGVDDQDPHESLFRLVEFCAETGVRTVIVHARKAWLQGLSPKENRQVPPLDYGLVQALKREHSSLTVVLNGGIEDLDQAARHLAWADGVMLGRAAYHRPGLLGAVDPRLFGEGAGCGEEEAVEAFLPYIERRLAEGLPLHAMTRHMLGLFSGGRGARTWRRRLTVEGSARSAGVEVVQAALHEVRLAQGGEDLRPAGASVDASLAAGL
jgi:tRNA-dihydrouridine synthase A